MLAPSSSPSARQLRSRGGSAVFLATARMTTTAMQSSSVQKTPSMSLNRAAVSSLDRRQRSRSRSLVVAASSSDAGSATLVSRDEEEGEQVVGVFSSSSSSSSSPSSPLVVVCPPPTPSSSSSSSPSSSSTTNNNSKKRLALFVASAALAHPDKAHYGGEDAWFHSPVSGTIGVADGVGGWADSGICPAEYARELMTAARSAAEGVPPRRVTVESLAESRGTAATTTTTTTGTTTTTSSTSTTTTTADGEGAAGEGFGVPLSCFDAAGGGAPPPPDVAAVSDAASFAAAAPSSSSSPEGGYGEDGGAPSLSSLLSSSSSPSSSPSAVAVAPSSSPSPSLPPPSELPTAALSAAHAAVRLPGSATACVVTLDEEAGTLHGVSVGDAGALVVRKRRTTGDENGNGSKNSSSSSAAGGGGGVVLFRSRPSYHSFDCPRQLAAVPEFVEWSDGVGDGERFEVEGLEEGDVVVVASDGVFDNAWTDELMALLPDFPDPEASSSPSSSSSIENNSVVARDVAERIARLAAQNSRDELYPSPYAAEAAAAGVTNLNGERGGDASDIDLGAAIGSAVSSFAKLFGASQDGDGEEEEENTRLVGGKLDDITVVVAVVGRV